MIKNTHGYEMDFDAAYMYMDRDLAQKVEYMIGQDECAESDPGFFKQWFFSIYCHLHEEKYGEEFELAKPNPCW